MADRAMARLTDRTVRTAAPGRHGDDAVRGLMLVVWRSGARSWILRYQLHGRRRDMGLGPYPEITLARAREKALEARRHGQGRPRSPGPAGAQAGPHLQGRR